LIVKLKPRAEVQLQRLPRKVAQKVYVALRVLAVVPHSGRRLPDDDAAVAGLMSKTVRVRRGWSYRIVYEVVPGGIDVHLIVPTWLDLRKV
jgi:mRNA-degrading endonuclease RelE of RelBE toxin-antitoxin system